MTRLEIATLMQTLLHLLKASGNQPQDEAMPASFATEVSMH